MAETADQCRCLTGIVLSTSAVSLEMSLSGSTTKQKTNHDVLIVTVH